MEVWRGIADALGQYGRCALISVVQIRGSAPREAGARMLVMPDGGYRGTIGGGALEWQAIAHAREALSGQGSRVSVTRHVLGADLGQCCGGSVKLLTEVMDRSQLPEVEALRRHEGVAPFSTVGDIGPGMVSREVLDGQAATAGAALVDGDTRIRECFGGSPQRLYLFGAGHVGRALMLALAPLSFRVTWVDQRDVFPGALPANVEALQISEPAAPLASAPAGSFIVVMTHSHPLDLEIVDAALRAGRFPYVGLIGSASKRARFTSMLQRGGLSRAALAPLVCPIGVAGIESKQPAAIAAAVTAQLLSRVEELARAPATRAATGAGP